jgi:hypothetical protein
MKAMGEQRWFGWVRRLIGYEPIRHGRLEMGLLRAAFAWVLAAGMHVHASGLRAQPRPHGFGRWIDFTFIGDPAWFEPLLTGCFVAIGLFACGFVPLVALGYVLVFQTAVSTLNLSQGSQGHSGQVVMLAVLGWWVGELVVWVRGGCGWRGLVRSGVVGGNAGADGARQAVVAAYAVAGIAKVVNSGGEWLERSGNFVLQWRKVVEEGRFSYGLEPTGMRRAFGSVLLEAPWVATVLLTGGLVLELGAFAGLLNRRAAIVFGVLVIGFHLMLGVLMGLPFIEYRRLVLVLFVNPAWPLALVLGAAWRRWGRRGDAP